MEDSQKKQGSLIQADFFNNSGGLNITDSPFQVKNGQAVAGYNYEYLATGGITKRQGHTILNSAPDSQLRSLGFHNYFTPGNVKTQLRMAGTRLQTVNPLSGVTTSVISDQATPASDLFTTTQPVVTSQFTTPTMCVAWMAGGGQASATINGYYGTKFTANGADTPVGTLSTTTSTTAVATATGTLSSGSNTVTGLGSTTGIIPGLLVSGTGIPGSTYVSTVTGTTITLTSNATVSGSESLQFHGSLPDSTVYFYAISLVKTATNAESNAVLDVIATTGVSGFGVAGGNTVTVSWTLTGLDTTKYSMINIYRASVDGSIGFTIGDLAGSVVATATSFVDEGIIQLTAQPVPRAFNTLLDNSALPAGSYNVLTTWKSRLVTATGSTVWLSDLNKPESWPQQNFITVASGGPITALAIISYITPTTAVTDELLVIFKEREIWVIAGTDSTDWALKFVDFTGTVAQPLVVLANGFLFWVDYRGVFLWDGSDKPIYISRLIEYDFSINGDLDLSKLALGCGSFYRKQNEIIWFLSSSSLGEQLLTYKLDLRLSLPNVQQNLEGRVAEAVFIKDSLSYPVYATYSALPNFSGTFLTETLYAGDAAGNIFTMFSNGTGDGPNPIKFTHRTKIQDFGSIGTAKRFHKVIVWCRQSTTANITLKYFVSYQTDDAHSAVQSLPVTTQVTAPLWDEATWDSAYWDLNIITYTPVVFNLGNPSIGIEGDALTLEFQQQDLGAPMIIAGYSILYSITGLRK